MHTCPTCGYRFLGVKALEEAKEALETYTIADVYQYRHHVKSCLTNEELMVHPWRLAKKTLKERLE